MVIQRLMVDDRRLTVEYATVSVHRPPSTVYREKNAEH